MNKPSEFDHSKLAWEKSDGLLPAIVQHADSGKVLMLAYMNATALQRTLATGMVTFFSRSRQQLWQKGETSGNTLELIAIQADCDHDTLLLQARPAGPVCHLNTPTCFGDQHWPKHAFIGELDHLIQQRKSADTQSSYTARLLAEPVTRVAQKVGEEGVETALAAVADDPSELVNEAADLLYHLQVLLARCGLDISVLSNNLQQRHRSREPQI